jgi:dimethylaniline monooxygenase (N-oxide forming)
MVADSKKVIVIGAGGAGLAALHAMHQARFDAVAFEKNSELGGVWATTLYPSLTIHSKSFNYRFHDFPAVASNGPSATREEIRAYFADFARKKGIEGKIVYHRRIDRIVHRPRLDARRCLVFSTDLRTGETSEDACDVVVCATGFSNAGRPHVPTLEGNATSNVQVLHSSDLTPELFDDIVAHRRKIVILGAGKSAHEILWLFRQTDRVPDLTWVYAKSLWSLKYEMLYSSSPIPWNVIWYLYYIALSTLRRRIGFGALMKVLQAPLRWSGLLVNPLEPDSDVCVNRSAIMKEEQLTFLRTVRSVKTEVVGLGERTIRLANGETIEADYLVCATGYDRSIDIPKVEVEAPDGTRKPEELTAQHGFYRQMINLAVPDISVLAANVLYPQQLLGYSLGAQWLARFHRGDLAKQPTLDAMTRSMADDAGTFSPWASREYRSGGQPYAHQRNENVLPHLFDQMGLPPSLARSLVTSGANPQKFATLCDAIARRLDQRGLGK